MSSAEIAAGTRVRLRDTGRLGTVVGKKAGGWWQVDLLEAWNGGGAAELAGGEVAAAENDAASTAGSGPVSTRRGNMQPLGNAYASTPSLSSSSEATNAAIAAAAPWKANVPGSKRRRVSSSKSSRSADTAAAAAPAAPAAIGKAAATKTKTTKKAGAAAVALPAVLPPPLAGQTISLEVPAPTGATPVTPEGVEEAVAVAISKMSSEGLAHAAMKEWLVFSDLHVSPGSLAVTLEVRVAYGLCCLLPVRKKGGFCSKERSKEGRNMYIRSTSKYNATRSPGMDLMDKRERVMRFPCFRCDNEIARFRSLAQRRNVLIFVR